MDSATTRFDRRRALGLGVLGLSALLAASCSSGRGDPRYPASYPAEYQDLVAGAERGGQLVIWSTTDRDQVTELLAAFSAKYPSIKVDYREMSASEIHQRFLEETARNVLPADLLWSSAMDLQIKLVNDGYTQRFVSPERRQIAPWANWKNQAWGVTAEPIVFVYNTAQIAKSAAPNSHAALRSALIEQPALRGKVVTYDPSTSAIGYLLATHDELADHHLMQTAGALGAAQVRLLANSQEILSEVAEGRAAVGYNVIGSYAAEYAKQHPDLAVVVPKDYALVVSRIAIIPAAAPHPDASKIFLTFLLSREGQLLLAKHSMPSLRRDVPTPPALVLDRTIRKEIHVGPALLVTQDKLTKESFLQQWNAKLRP